MALTVAGSATATLSAQSVVLSEGFEAEQFPPQGWTLNDVDADGNCWMRVTGSSWVSQPSGSKALAASFTRNPASYDQSYGAQDNWLITPPIKITHDAFALSLLYAAQDIEQTEPMEILVSTDEIPTISSFKQLCKMSVDNGYDDNVSHQTLSKVLSDYVGKTIYIAIRHAASYTYGLSVDNVKILNNKGPQPPTGFTATPDASGATSVTLAWTNPARQANGADLSELTIVIYRDGEEIARLDSQTPGASATYTDTTLSQGSHLYTIAAANAEGESERLTQKKIYVGDDRPTAVGNPVALATADGVLITWEAPTKGANKGVFNPAAVRYSVYRSVDGAAYEQIASDLAECRYLDTTAPYGKTSVYEVKGENAGGVSDVADHTAALPLDPSLCVGAVAQNAVRDNTLTRLPIDINSKYSVSQTVYYPEDLNYVKGDISQILYRTYRGTDTELSMPVAIYMHNSSVENLNTQWDNTANAVKVFEGNIAINQGVRDVAVNLTTPFAYEGGNLVVTFIKTDNPQGSYSDRFLSATSTRTGRSMTTSVYNPVEISALPAPSYSTKCVAEVPATRFVISPKGTVALSGKVVNAADQSPLKGAVVSVPSVAGMQCVTAEDGAYSFPYLSVTADTLNVVATGYETASFPITLTEGETVTKNLELTRLPYYAANGVVRASDTSLPASGAVISVSGYEDLTLSADADGAFAIPALYCNQDYNITVTYPLYDMTSLTLNRTETEAHNLGDIVLERSRIAAYGLAGAVAEDGSAVALTWLSPVNRECVPGVKSVGDVSVQKYTGGDYYTTDYCVAHAFTADQVKEQKLEGLSIKSIRAYLKATAGDFSFCVWSGNRDNHKLLASVPVSLDKISADGDWVELEFPMAPEIRGGEGLMFGVHCVNPSSSPIGEAASSTIYDGNNIRFTDLEGASTSNAYSAWCIQAICEIPGSHGAVVDNADVPACAYNVYRYKHNAADESPVWTRLNPSPLTNLSYTDAEWTSLPSGTYTYAVAAVYRDSESAKSYALPLERRFDRDCGVSAILSPAKSIEVQSAATVKVRVANYGEKPAENFAVAVTLNGSEVARTTVAESLAPGADVEVELGQVNLPEGALTLEAYTQLEGDEVSANDACTLLLPNMVNVAMKGYRWNAYGNAGFMDINTNVPEKSAWVMEVTPADALIIGGEYLNGKYYGYTATWWGEPRGMAVINVANMAIEDILPVEEYVMDMAYDYPNRRMYGLRPDGYNCEVVTIDLTTGQCQSYIQIDEVLRALACNAEGKLFGINDAGDLVSIAESGELTVIGNPGFGQPAYLQSMAFDHNSGRLFWAATNDTRNGVLYEIDPITGTGADYGSVLFNDTEPCEIVGLYSEYTHNYSGVAAPTAPTVVSTRWYLPTGVEINGDAVSNSVVIRVDRMSDGTLRTTRRLAHK